MSFFSDNKITIEEYSNGSFKAFSGSSMKYGVDYRITYTGFTTNSTGNFFGSSNIYAIIDGVESLLNTIDFSYSSSGGCSTTFKIPNCTSVKFKGDYATTKDGASIDVRTDSITSAVFSVTGIPHPPTAPSYVSCPNSAMANTGVNVTWGASSDVDGDTISYTVDFFNGSSWLSCGTTTGTSLTYGVPNVNANCRFRVSAKDSTGLSSGVTYSNYISVSNNSAPTISGNSNDALGNKNAPFNIIYSVNDIDGTNVLNVIEKLNGTQIKSINGAIRNNNYIINITKEILDSLPINTQNTIQISVTDSVTTTYKTITFTKTYSGPVVSNYDKDLGQVIKGGVLEKYICTDITPGAFTIVEKLNTAIIKSFNGIVGTEYSIDIPESTWFTLPNGINTYTVTITDSLGFSVIRTFTFTKKETVIEIIGLTHIINTDIAATKILLTASLIGKENSDIIFEVCNNGFDVNPTWENATTQTILDKPYTFTNTVKTASNWGIDIRVKISLKEGVIEGTDFYGLGGAFE